MKVDGACHCGAITYEAEVDPDLAAICHCTDCQTMTSSAFRLVVRAQEANFRLTGGKMQSYVKTAESGNPREQTFCPTCATPIYSTSVAASPEDSNRTLSLRAGAIRQRDQLVPKHQIWTRSAQPWLPDIGALPATEKQDPF